MAKEKKRLDALIQELYPHLTRNQIQSFIVQGKVKVNDIVNTKPGTQVGLDAVIGMEADQPKFASRAGFKLEAALEHFKVDVAGLVALDAGISTGGFTDCLLQNGIKRVYGIDVGYGQVHEKVRTDPRLILMEKTNLRLLEGLPEKVDLVTLDLSFISILKVMPALVNVIKPTSKIITLIKPQFEAEREDIQRGGVVRDARVHERVIEKVKQGMKEFGFTMVGVIESPIVGATSGNKEFLALFTQEN
ncbi:TlyA family RNA methyltransferase [Candidatus Babeliales bacterium]|nr:TlyA family RNA methyltransferase [Candidatus Babeliales bacterium]